jgi:hypothetical protein
LDLQTGPKQRLNSDMLASLPYEAVCSAASPEEALLAFLQSSYDAAAVCGNWDRKALERLPGGIDVPG